VFSVAKIEIYTSPWCGYCSRAKALLHKKGADFEEIDVSMNSELRAHMVSRANGARTVPQIFIDGKHIGGSDDLYDLDRSGGLDPLLQA